MLHLPFKRLKFLFSTTTLAIEKDVQAIVAKIKLLGERRSTITAEEASIELSGLINKLESLQHKLEETNRQEQLLADHLRSRLANLSSFINSTALHDEVAIKLWYRHQTDRLIVDFLVREGEYERAAEFSLDSNLSDFEDVDLFLGKVKPVVESLRNGDYKEVVKWMHMNASKLKKLDANLVARFELELRLQEFLGMIQDGKSAEAIAFAQQTFLVYAEMGDYFSGRIKHAMSSLVFLGMKDSPVAQEFVGPQRWNFLIREFHKLFFHLYGLSNEPLLSIAILAGLQATATPTCVRHAVKDKDVTPTSTAHIDCPSCSLSLKSLLTQISLPHRPTSSLVCPITHIPIDETNYPMALPNGQVYSKKAIDLHSASNTFTDPSSGVDFELNSIRRVFIM